jgi:type 1 glutamine amidotransferase
MKGKSLFLWVLLVLAGCSKGPEVLVIVGGHAYDTTEFYEMFHSLEGIHFDSVSHPAALELISSPRVENYDVLLFYDFLPDMPAENSSIYTDLTRKGMPMIFMHHALGTCQEWEGYGQMVGGKYIMPTHEKDSSLHSGYEHDLDLTIKVLDPEHPVTRGISEFTIHDEGYYNILMHDAVHPLLGTSHPHSAPVMAWENLYQNSTCLYFMFGHDKLAYSNESLKLLLENSIQYLSNL